MTLSIIIVNYNVKALLNECLASVQRAIANLEAEVLVVDNASSDGSVEFLQPRFPRFDFISSAENIGFSRANNLALTLATGRYVLFLNPDTQIPHDCFEKCIGFMDAHPEAGALGVRMLDAEGRFLKESKRGFPTPLVSFWKLSGIAAMFPHSRYFSKYYLGHLSELEVQEVEVLSGAFMFARKMVLDKTGGFDERFFMYAEDIDLSYRIIKAGFKNFYFPQTTILHHKGASTKKDIRYIKQFYKAMSQFSRKYYGSNLFSLTLDIGIWLRAAIETLRPGRNRK